MREEVQGTASSRAEEPPRGRAVQFGDFQTVHGTPVTSTTSRATLTTSTSSTPLTLIADPDFNTCLSLPLPSSPSPSSALANPTPMPTPSPHSPSPIYLCMCITCGAGYANESRLGDHFRRVICLDDRGASLEPTNSMPSLCPVTRRVISMVFLSGLKASLLISGPARRFILDVPFTLPTFFPPIPPDPFLDTLHSSPSLLCPPPPVFLPFVHLLIGDNRRPSMTALALLLGSSIPDCIATQAFEGPQGERSRG